MKVRHEVRRLSENLGTEIRELFTQHSCSKFRIPNGMCMICDLSRVRGMELAALAYCRAVRLPDIDNPVNIVLHNESELIDLVGREKIERKIRFQLKRAQKFISGVCKACGRMYTYPLTKRELSICLTYRQKSYGHPIILRGECQFCGFQNTLEAAVDSSLKTLTGSDVAYLTGLIAKWGIRYTDDARKDMDIIAAGHWDRTEEEEEDDPEYNEEDEEPF